MPATTADVSTAPDADAPRDNRAARIAVALVVVVLAVGALLGLRNEWTPVLDIAALEIRVQAMPDVLPLLGVFSRMGWFHPGPAIFYQSWGAYNLWGPIGLNVAMVGVHLLALVTAWWLARRQDRLVAAMLLLAMVVVLLLEPATTALEPWNPYAGTIASFTYLMAAWGVSRRHAAATALLLPLGSYLLQNHLGYAPFLGLVALAAVLLAWLPPRTRAPVPWRAWVIGAVVAAVMWVPVLYQQLTGTPGNLTTLLTTPGEGDRAGVARGVQALFEAFSLPPYWASGDVLSFSGTWQIPWMLLVPICAAIIAIVRRDTMGLQALAICGAGSLSGIIAIAVTNGLVVGYLVVWLPVVAVTSVCLGLWVIVRPLATTKWSMAFYVAAVVLSILAAMGWARADQEYPEYGRASMVLGTALHDQADGSAVYLSNLPGQGFAQLLDIRQVYYGVLATAVREGTEVIVPESISWEVGGVLTPSATPASLGVPQYAVAALRPDLTDVVAVYNPLSPQETAEFFALEERISQSVPESPEQEQLLETRDQLVAGRFPMALVRVGP